MRNDIHSPKSINPALYSYVDSFDVEIEADGTGLWAELLTDTNIDRPYAGHFDRCDHCGAHFKYGNIYRFRTEENTGGFIVVGDICAENTMDVPDRATLNQERLRSAAATRRANEKMAREREAALEATKDKYPEAYNILKDYDGENYFIYDVSCRMQKWGTLSEKQAEAVTRSFNRDKEYAAQKEEQEANATPVVEGKGIKITGTVRSAYCKDTAYGTRFVMTVQDDRGFAVWGTRPLIEDRIDTGDRVEFIANVEKSDSDETFGFFKRPRKLAKI